MFKNVHSPLSRLPPKLVPLLVRAVFGGWRHRLSSRYRSMFNFHLVLSSLYTPDFYYIHYVPYLTPWPPSLFCALLFVMWVRVLVLWIFVFSVLEFYSSFLIKLSDYSHLCVPRLTLPFSIHQHPHSSGISCTCLRTSDNLKCTLKVFRPLDFSTYC